MNRTCLLGRPHSRPRRPVGRDSASSWSWVAPCGKDGPPLHSPSPLMGTWGGCQCLAVLNAAAGGCKRVLLWTCVSMHPEGYLAGESLGIGQLSLEVWEPPAFSTVCRRSDRSQRLPSRQHLHRQSSGLAPSWGAAQERGLEGGGLVWSRWARGLWCPPGLGHQDSRLHSPGASGPGPAPVLRPLLLDKVALPAPQGLQPTAVDSACSMFRRAKSP